MKNLILFLSLFSSTYLLNSKEYLCYVPGGAGLSDYMHHTVGGELKSRGIPFVAFNAGPWGSVEERSARVINDFQKLLDKDPKAECHLFGYSMGGLVLRYSVNHLSYRARNGRQVAFKSRIKTMSSFSSPHHGTPAANVLNDFPEILRPGLEQLSLKNIQRFNDEKYNEYSPVVKGIPFYSYRNFVAEDEEIPDFSQRISYAYIVSYYVLHLKFPWSMNDGLVPTRSMEFGEVLDARHLYDYGLPYTQQIVEDDTPRERYERPGDFRYPHEFYSQDLEMDISPADIFQAHYNFVSN